MTFAPGCHVILRVALPEQYVPAGVMGRVVRVSNGWLDVQFDECYLVRGIDPAKVREATVAEQRDGVMGESRPRAAVKGEQCSQ